MNDVGFSQYNCVVTFSRLLSPQLIGRCSLLVHYDSDDVTSRDDDVISGDHRLHRVVLRSTRPETNNIVENCGLVVSLLILVNK